MYINHHVVFNESLFPFHFTHTSNLPFSSPLTWLLASSSLPFSSSTPSQSHIIPSCLQCGPPSPSQPTMPYSCPLTSSSSLQSSASTTDSVYSSLSLPFLPSPMPHGDSPPNIIANVPHDPNNDFPLVVDLSIMPLNKYSMVI